MSPHPIAVVVGSLRRDSFNRKLATAVAGLAPSGFSFTQVDMSGMNTRQAGMALPRTHEGAGH